MRRRDLIALAGLGSIARSAVAAAQQAPNPPRIGYLRFASATASVRRVAALRAGLRDLGYVEGKNIVIEFRWAERFEQLAEFAGDPARARNGSFGARLCENAGSPGYRAIMESK